MGITNEEVIQSKLTLDRTDEKARQILEEVRQMKKDGKTFDEIDAYLKASDFYKKVSTSKVEFWCLPVGVDPKTIWNNKIKGYK
jgi:hypothetical protein